jgi:predicted dehydrogenase
VISSDDVDTVYIPLPPALHFKWAKQALENGKHTFVEKPFTTNLKDTLSLLSIARKKGLAVQENYMFQYHQQLLDINNIIESGKLGDVRLYRISFGFPLRKLNDFRYNKVLGGGATLDCCGYTIKYASMLLGPTAKVVQAQSNYLEDSSVDIYGSAVMTNENGFTAQLAFGMDNSYKCELEVWGSKACLLTNRVLTAPAGLSPDAVIIDSHGNEEKFKLPADDAFGKSILEFGNCIINKDIREENYNVIERQAELLNEYIRLAK